MSRRNTGLVAVAAAFVLGVAGCGASGPGEELALAADATTATETARFELVTEMRDNPMVGDVTMPSEGEIDFSEGLVLARTDMGAMGPELEGEDLTMDVITDGAVMWIRQPMMGDQWLRLDIEEAGLATDAVGATGSAGMGQDPATQLDFLRGVSDDIEEVGTEDVRGVTTTHYEVTVDMEAAVEEVPDEEAREALTDIVEQMGMQELPMEVWVDEDDLVRRIAVEMDMSDAGHQHGGMEGSIKNTIEYYDFGAEVDITPPPDDEVVDFTDRFGGQPAPDEGAEQD